MDLLDSEERRLRVWNTATWKVRWEYPCRQPRDHRSASFWILPFSPDGRLVALEVELYASGREPETELILLDAATGRELAHLPGLASQRAPDKNQTLQFSPDKKTIATWHADQITLWDARTFRKQRELKAANPTALVSNFSRDGSLLWAATEEGRCHLWETATGKERLRAEGSRPELSPDGKTLLTVLPGGIVKFWDTASGREKATIRGKSRGKYSGCFSGDSKYVLVRAGLNQELNGRWGGIIGEELDLRLRPIDVCIYDASTGAERQRLPGKNTYDVSAYFSPDGRTVAYSRLEDGQTQREEVVLCDVESGREHVLLRSAKGALPRQLSPDGAALLTSDGYLKNLRLWHVPSGRSLVTFPGDIEDVFFSADGQWLAAVPTWRRYDGDLHVFHHSARKLTKEPAKNESAEKVKELQMERMATLKEMVDHLDALIARERPSAERLQELYEARLQLLKAELDAAEKELDRIALFKHRVDVLKKYETLAEPRVKKGREPQTFFLKVKARRLEAEINLEQAKAKEAKECK